MKYYNYCVYDCNEDFSDEHLVFQSEPFDFVEDVVGRVFWDVKSISSFDGLYDIKGPFVYVVINGWNDTCNDYSLIADYRIELDSGEISLSFSSFN